MPDARLRTLRGQAIPTQSDYLIEFVTIAQEGSFAKAAIALSSSQSSLSRHLKSVESNLGMTLLERHSDGVTLTEAGRYVFNRTGDIIDAVQDILLYASEHHDTDLIAIGGMTIFPKVMRMMLDMQAASAEPVKLKSLPTGTFTETEIVDMLDNHYADAYLTMDTDGRLDYLDDEYQIFPAFSSPVVAVMQETNPLAAKPELLIGDLEGQLLFHAQTSFDGERVNWEDTKVKLHRANVDYRSKTCTLEDRANLMVDLKNGLMLLPEAYYGIDLLREAGRVVQQVKGLEKNFIVVCRKGEQVGTAIEAMHLGTIS